MTRLLEVRGLSVRFRTDVEALRDLSFDLERGETLAIVGESGAGKSTLALCLAGLVQAPEARGSIRLNEQEIVGAPEEVLRSLRWSTIALALQGAPFNPVATIGTQVSEPLRDRGGLSRAAAQRRTTQLADEVLLDQALLDRYPHQLSGGELRRAMLAMVLALDPTLVVLDEPTAGLDTATSRELVRRVRSLAEVRGFGLIVISHDLPDAARLGEKTLVMYAGRAIEVGGTDLVMAEPAHPYSWALVNAFPVMSTTKDLRPIRGRAPDPRAVPSGCAFHPRCTQAEEECEQRMPMLAGSRGRLVACHFGGLKQLVRATNLHKTFRDQRGEVRALENVTIDVQEGESVGIIGPSGGGKSTLARILTGHLAPDAGYVRIQGMPLPASWRGESRVLRRRIQLIMQDPNDALSPRLSVEQLVREPLDVAKDGDARRRSLRVAEALESVGLPSSGSFLDVRIHELSGGQLQRIAIARALVIRPKLLVADEPTAMLDASEQARLLVVLRERQTEMGLGLIFISHDMAVVRKITDRIVVLDGGRVVESGPSAQVSNAPTSLAGRALVKSAPSFMPRASEDTDADQRGTE